MVGCFKTLAFLFLFQTSLKECKNYVGSPLDLIWMIKRNAVILVDGFCSLYDIGLHVQV